MSTGAVSDKHNVYFQTLVPGTSHVVAFTNTSGQSAAFGSATTCVQIFATKDCWILAGSNPTAVAVSSGSNGSSMFLPAGIINFMGVTAGYKLAVIRDADNGTLHIVEGL